jgi:hypothetical protein
VATGFIALSRRFGFDPQNYHHLTIQDTIDTLGQAVLGLTLGCARCHDHKYDPVTRQDYCGVYGIFASTRYAFPGSEATHAGGAVGVRKPRYSQPGLNARLFCPEWHLALEDSTMNRSLPWGPVALAALCLLIGYVFGSAAQEGEKKGRGLNEPDAGKEAGAKDAANKANVNTIESAMDTYVKTLIGCSLGILAAGAAALWLIASLLREGKLPAEKGPQLIGLIVVVCFGTFIVVAGYGQTQMAPLMTILGAALGYLFGQDWRSTSGGSTASPPASPPT